MDPVIEEILGGCGGSERRWVIRLGDGYFTVYGWHPAITTSINVAVKYGDRSLAERAAKVIRSAQHKFYDLG